MVIISWLGAVWICFVLLIPRVTAGSVSTALHRRNETASLRVVEGLAPVAEFIFALMCWPMTTLMIFIVPNYTTISASAKFGTDAEMTFEALLVVELFGAIDAGEMCSSIRLTRPLSIAPTIYTEHRTSRGMVVK